jgi:aspartyl-tRNA(Asn)/glutamyl-tRNA(Gln) amidotransferase subunit B
VHLEEDTGKLTHVSDGSLVDLNRAGVALLEIVSEPDMHSVDEAKSYAETLRAVLRYLQVNSGDMEKGVIRFEANVSVSKVGATDLGKRVEIKNLNSFRALEHSAAFEIQRQSDLLSAGGRVEQETLGWDETAARTYSQRSKEDAQDYRYFPGLICRPRNRRSVDRKVRAGLPELPLAKARRLVGQYELNEYTAGRLVEEREHADYFERAAGAGTGSPQLIANWLLGELFAIANSMGGPGGGLKVGPEALANLVGLVEGGEVNQSTGKLILAEMYADGKTAQEIVEARGLRQVSDATSIARWVEETLEENPTEVASFKAGKLGVANFLFGQAMRKAAGQANPKIVKEELERKLASV